MGQAHVDVLLVRLRDRYGVKVESESPQWPCGRYPPLSWPRTGHGRHIKQSWATASTRRVQYEHRAELPERGAGFSSTTWSAESSHVISSPAWRREFRARLLKWLPRRIFDG